MRNRGRKQLALLVLFFLLALEVSGKIARTTLANVVTVADVIVVATDVRVEERRGLRIAEASVEQVLKGGADLKRVSYVADPSWACDTAEARVGERAVLFLSTKTRKEGSRRRPPRRLDGQALFDIAWAGRGRMPVRTVEDAPYATVWTVDIEMPASLATIPGPEPEYDFIRSVSLGPLLELVNEIVGASRQAAV